MSKNKTDAPTGKVDTTNPVEKFISRKYMSMLVIIITSKSREKEASQNMACRERSMLSS
jgi:hypothetical protein